MSARDLAFASLVILLWGLNFVVIKVGLDSLPPMLLGATRFTLAAIPAIFFIRRPQVPLRWLIAYGTSWHFGLSFGDNGPEGYGLVSYGQSDDAESDHFDDQDQRYSNKNYRTLLYRQADIAADPNLETETIEATVDTQ